MMYTTMAWLLVITEKIPKKRKKCHHKHTEPVVEFVRQFSEAET